MRPFIVAILACGFALPAQASVNEGIDAYNAGDCRTAFDQLFPPAADGDATAQMFMGFMYSQNKCTQTPPVWPGLTSGEGQDYAEAARWFQLASDQGLQSATYDLAMLYRDGGPGLPRNFGSAANLLAGLAQKGDLRATMDLGHLYLAGGTGLQQDMARAYALFSIVAASAGADPYRAAGAEMRESVIGAIPITDLGGVQVLVQGEEFLRQWTANPTLIN